MEWKTPVDAEQGGDSRPDICIVISPDSLSYRMRIDYGIQTDFLTVGKDFEYMVQYEVGKSYSPRSTIIDDPTLGTNRDSCPAGMKRMHVHIVKIECDNSSNAIGANSVSAMAYLELELSDPAGNRYSGSFVSPKVKTLWPWLTSPSVSLARTAIPAALQWGLRKNLEYIIACEAGRCKTKAELAIPAEVWVQDRLFDPKQ